MHLAARAPMRLVETAAVYDQLDLTNCAWAETALHRVQAIEWACQDRLREGGGALTGRIDVETTACPDEKTCAVNIKCSCLVGAVWCRKMCTSCEQEEG